MLNHKKSMLRVLLLVLSVLMVVSLAACGNKDSGDDGMNEALSQAIADQQAALESQKKAQEDAAAAAKAEQEKLQAELDAANKAAEEAKAAAEKAAKEAAEKAEKAAKEAAEKAAKEAADKAAAAEKAAKEAAESAKKAQESLAAALESQKKEQAALSESISKSLADAATATNEPTSAPAATDTEAIKSVIADFAKMRAEYNAKMDMYVGTNADEIHMYFEKASIELTFASTLEAAQDIYNQLVIDVEAVESAATVAADINALIANLGDVESQVITTAATKLDAINKAWADMVQNYGEFLNADYNSSKDEYSVNAAAIKIAQNDLGLNLNDLNKANSKMAVLKDYVANSLSKDLEALYAKFELDFDEDGDDLGVAMNDTTDAADVIADAYYKYQVLSVINGGDTAVADIAVDWEFKYDETTGKVVKDKDGNKVIDESKPIAFFTSEQFIDLFATPYLNKELDGVKTLVIDDLKAAIALNATKNSILESLSISNATVAAFTDVDDAWDDIVDAFEDELEAITFANSYKTKVTLDEAKADIYDKAVATYIDLLATYIETSKEIAKEAEAEVIANQIEGLNDDIDAAQDQLAETENASKIERLNAQIAKYQENIAKAEAKLVAFKANVDAAAMYTIEELTSEETEKTYKTAFVDISDLAGVAGDTADAKEATVKTFLGKVVSDIINKNFASEIKTSDVTADGELGSMISLLKEDLENLKDRLDPNYEKKEAPANSIFYEGWKEDTKKGTYTGDAVVYLDNWYANSQKFADMVAIVDAAIAELDALTADDFTDEVKNLTFPAKKDEAVNGANWGEKKIGSTVINGKAAYFINEAAMNYALVEMEWNELELLANYSKVLTTTATDYPLTYTYTAAEQAAIKAQSIYDAAYDDVFAALMAFKSPVGDLQKEINNKDKTIGKHVTTLSGKATGDLKAEIDAFVKIYTDKIAALDDKHDNYITVDTHAKSKFWLGANTDSEVEDSHVWIEDVTADSLETNASFTLTGIIDDIKEAAGDKDNKIIKEFVDRFFVGGTVASSALSDTNVYVLWDYKTKAVERITKAIEAYENNYVQYTGEDNALKGMYILTSNSKYAYDIADETVAGVKYVKSIDANAEAYKAQLASLLNTYTGKIMAVKLNSNSTISTYLSGDDKIFAADSKTAGIERAKAMVDSYVVDLFGYEAAKNIEGTNYTAGATDIYATGEWIANGATYANADSRIFNAYYTIFDTSMTKVSLTK